MRPNKEKNKQNNKETLGNFQRLIFQIAKHGDNGTF